MMAKNHLEYMTHEECGDKQRSCQAVGRTVWLALAGIMLPILAGIIIYTYSWSRAQAEMDGTQNEKIRHLEKREDQLYQMMIRIEDKYQVIDEMDGKIDRLLNQQPK
jgi:hypothetical protein